jgi:Fe-S oxidoreductase
VLLPGTQALAANAFLFEEFIASEAAAGRFAPKLKSVEESALLHGHCHQKAFDALSAVEKTLGLVPGLKVRTVQSSCCGMAGAFGYEAEHYEVSMKMAEDALLPAVRNAPDALLVADGTSCRQQILHGAGREALHVARVLEKALA